MEWPIDLEPIGGWAVLLESERGLPRLSRDVEVGGWGRRPRLLRHHHPEQNVGHLADGENQYGQQHGDDSGQGDVPTVLVGEPLADTRELPSGERPH
jgi:hypothetical protein